MGIQPYLSGAIMKYDFSKLKRGDYVNDPFWGMYQTGRVTKKLKTVVYVKFRHHGTLKYDKQHAEHFLQRLGRRPKNTCKIKLDKLP